MILALLFIPLMGSDFSKSVNDMWEQIHNEKNLIEFEVLLHILDQILMENPTEFKNGEVKRIGTKIALLKKYNASLSKLKPGEKLKEIDLLMWAEEMSPKNKFHLYSTVDEVDSVLIKVKKLRRFQDLHLKDLRRKLDSLKDDLEFPKIDLQMKRDNRAPLKRRKKEEPLEEFLQKANDRLKTLYKDR